MNTDRRHPLQPLWERGFRLLIVADAVALFGLMVLINQLRFGSEWPDFSRRYYFAGFAIATTVHLVINYLAGLYEREPRLGALPWLPRVTLATVIGVAAEALVYLLLDRYLMPRLNLLVLAGSASIVLTANRSLSRALARRFIGPARVVLVGTADEASLAERHLLETNAQTVVVATTEALADVSGVAQRSTATDVLLLGQAAYAQVFPKPLQRLEEQGLSVFQQVTAAQTLLGLHQIREIGGMPFVLLRSRTLPRHKFVQKRMLDLTLLVLGSPFILLVGASTALWVRLRAGRPVLYRQVRVGWGGEPFEMVKFRTMRTDAEAAGAVLATSDDPRVVRGLGWMRGVRLDELPQLWHVARGQMSIVGPRPERPEFTARLAAEVPGYERRFELPPGLTGLAQVNGRYLTDAQYKIGYDLQYVADWSLLLDIQLLARTVWVVLSRRV
jgi:exopolysaccharide biosynthesis polyprenyl glycosylphosphotransferase